MVFGDRNQEEPKMGYPCAVCGKNQRVAEAEMVCGGCRRAGHAPQRGNLKKALSNKKRNEERKHIPLTDEELKSKKKASDKYQKSKKGMETRANYNAEHREERNEKQRERYNVSLTNAVVATPLMPLMAFLSTLVHYYSL